jgi:hypothetical protein
MNFKIFMHVFLWTGIQMQKKINTKPNGLEREQKQI